MAIEQVIEGLQFAPLAGANLTGKLHYLVKMSADFTVVLAAAGSDQVVGVIREENTSGNPVTVQFGGIGKAIAGGTIVAGNRLTSDGSGKLVATTTAADKVVGVALMGADSGDICSFLFIPGHVAAS
jgi:Uncharacterized conserved protein (DUF2190)